MEAFLLSDSVQLVAGLISQVVSAAQENVLNKNNLQILFNDRDYFAFIKVVPLLVKK